MKSIVTMQDKPSGGLGVFHCCTYRFNHQACRHLRCIFVTHNTVVIQILDHRKIQESLFCLYVGDICYPFFIGLCRLKVAHQFIVVMGIGVTIIMTKSFAFSYSQQIIFAHNSQNCFVVDHKSRFSQQPYLNTAIAIGSMCFLVAFHD